MGTAGRVTNEEILDLMGGYSRPVTVHDLHANLSYNARPITKSALAARLHQLRRQGKIYKNLGGAPTDRRIRTWTVAR